MPSRSWRAPIAATIRAAPGRSQPLTVLRPWRRYLPNRSVMPGSLAQGIFRITADSGAPDVGAIADLSCTSTAPRVASVPAIHPDLAERAASAPPNENNDVIEN